MSNREFYLRGLLTALGAVVLGAVWLFSVIQVVRDIVDVQTDSVTVAYVAVAASIVALVWSDEVEI